MNTTDDDVIETPPPAAPGPLPSSLNAELTNIDALAEHAPELASPEAASSTPGPAVVVIDHEGEARDLIDFAYESFVPLYPSLETVYTEEKRKKIAVAAGRVMAKHGWTFETFMAGWGAELHLAMIVIPLVPATYRAVTADMAAAEAARDAAERADPPPAPSAPAQPATPGAPPSPNIPLE